MERTESSVQIVELGEIQSPVGAEQKNSAGKTENRRFEKISTLYTAFLWTTLSPVNEE